jgi:hypothetical protein
MKAQIVTVKVKLVGSYTRKDAVTVSDAMAEAARMVPGMKGSVLHVETIIKEG